MQATMQRPPTRRERVMTELRYTRDASEQRAQDTGTAGKGIETIANPHLREVFQALGQGNVFLQECDVVMPDSPRRTQEGAALRIPFVESVTAATAPGENTAIPKVDMVFGQRVINRHNAKTRVDGSIEFIQDNVDIFSVDRHMLVRLGMAELELITPDVLSNVSDSGITPAALSRGNLLALIETVDPSYLPGSIWMAHPSTVATMRGLSDQAAGAWDNPFRDGDDPRLEGYRVVRNVNMPTSGANAIAFGNFSYVVVDVAQVPTVGMTTEADGSIEFGQMRWYAHSRVGAALTVSTAVRGLNFTVS